MGEEINETIDARGFTILVDEQLTDSNGYLRSLPLLCRLCNGRIKKVITWEPGRNCNKPLNLTNSPLEFIPPDSFIRSKDFHCVFVNDEQEELFGYAGYYIESEIPGIIVVNHPGFVPKEWRECSKAIDNKTERFPQNYLIKLNDYLGQNGLLYYQLPQSTNLAFTETCYLHSLLTSERCQSLVELFNFDDERLAISPIWDWTIALCRLKQENVVANPLAFTFNALRPSIEHNKYVSQVTDVLLEFLQKHRFKAESITVKRASIIKSQAVFYKEFSKRVSCESYLNKVLRHKWGEYGYQAIS